MSSVTARIKQIKQPRGGYIKPSQFTVREIQDGNILSEEENISASTIGMAVDYLTRYMMGSEPIEAFAISLQGAKLAGAEKKAQKYLKEIKGLDENSIIYVCKLVGFDVWYRNPMAAMMSAGTEDINPDSDTIRNIRIMVERSMNFWEEYGPITKDGFTFEPNGYTKIVDAGDGDYLTADTLWDFKVSKSKLTSKHTLQLLMYWIMGQHSGKSEFKGITKLGIFNPRLNQVFTLEMKNVPQEVIQTVESEVICY